MQTPKWSIPNCKSVLPQTPKENKPVRNRKLSIALLITILVGNFFYLQLLQSQFSTLSLILVGTTLILLVVALLVNIRKKQRAKLFNSIVVGFVVFVMAFSGVGFYLSQFYGPTVPQVGYPEVLNVSLSSLLQNVVQSPSFRFIETEHFGTLTFESLSIHTTYSNAPQGGVNWDFWAGDTQSRLMVGQSSGNAYSYSSLGIGRGYPLPNHYPSDEQIAETFSQIDALGLNWFYDQAVLQYQNSTGHKPVLTALTLDLGYDSVGSYQGIVFTITALKEGRDDFGTKIYPMVFKVEFQPDGTILSAKH